MQGTGIDDFRLQIDDRGDLQFTIFDFPLRELGNKEDE